MILLTISDSSHSCSMRLLGMLSSTRFLGRNFDGRDVEGQPCHSKSRNSLERNPGFLEKSALWIFNNFSFFILRNGSSFNSIIFLSGKVKNMPLIASVPCPPEDQISYIRQKSIYIDPELANTLLLIQIFAKYIIYLEMKNENYLRRRINFSFCW